MKIELAVVAALALLSAAPAALADGKQDFTLVNSTGYVIDKVFVAPSKSDDWEEDVLGRDTLDNGESVHITFHRAEKSCDWDLKVIVSDDAPETLLSPLFGWRLQEGSGIHADVSFTRLSDFQADLDVANSAASHIVNDGIRLVR